MTMRDIGAPKDEAFKFCNLIGLRKFACPLANKKQNEWYTMCPSCDQNPACGVGKRVNEILKGREKLTKEEALDRKKNGSIVGGSTTASINIQRAKKQITEVFSGIKPEDRLLHYLYTQEWDVSINTVNAKLYVWAKKYPDLDKEFGIKKTASDLCSLRTAHKEASTVRDLLDILTATNKESAQRKDLEPMDEEDEVSLEDFLKENEHPENVTTDIPEEKKNDSPLSAQQVMLASFSAKRKEIRGQIEEINKKIETLQNNRNVLYLQIKSLDETAELFGMKAIHKEGINDL